MIKLSDVWRTAWRIRSSFFSHASWKGNSRVVGDSGEWRSVWGCTTVRAETPVSDASSQPVLAVFQGHACGRHSLQAGTHRLSHACCLQGGYRRASHDSRQLILGKLRGCIVMRMHPSGRDTIPAPPLLEFCIPALGQPPSSIYAIYAPGLAKQGLPCLLEASRCRPLQCSLLVPCTSGQLSLDARRLGVKSLEEHFQPGQPVSCKKTNIMCQRINLHLFLHKH